MNYSIVIPAWNEAAFLPATLTAVNAVVSAVDRNGVHLGEVIVVDNNSSDNTAAIAVEHGAMLTFEAVNQIAKARNAGAAIAKGEALIFLDADSQCSKELLLVVLEKLTSGSVVGGGSTIVTDKPVSTAALRGINFWNYLSKNLKLAAGCFVYCRRDAFDQVGGFSERVYAGEEIFLSRQLKRWARRNAMTFDIVSSNPVTTSSRKLQWYSSYQIIQQMLLMLIPGAVFSKRLCKTWYDSSATRR